jgi:hypothetical protein
MLKTIISITIFVFITGGTSRAQLTKNLVTDRPDQTESAFIVPKGSVQIELGAVYEREDFEDGILLENYSHPALLVRYGLLKTMELRLACELVNERHTFAGNSTGTAGFLPLAVGTKIYICNEENFRPQTALIMHVTIPKLGSKEFANEFFAADFRFTMQHSLSERFSLSYNLGAEWDGNIPNAAGIYTLSLSSSLTESIGAFIESYGFLIEKETPDHRIDGGLTYLLSRNLQLDASGGLGITDKSPDYFLGAGISLRLPE